MKRILFFLLILFSFSAGAQLTTQYLGAPNTLIHQRGIIRNDSADFIPADTLMRSSWPKTLPAIAGKNGLLYYWSTTLQKWMPTGTNYNGGYGISIVNGAIIWDSTKAKNIGNSDLTVLANRNVWLNGKYLSFNDNGYTANFNRLYTLIEHDNGSQGAKLRLDMDSSGDGGFATLRATSSTQSAEVVVGAIGDNAEGHMVAAGTWYVAKKGYANIGDASEKGITVYTDNTYGPSGDVKFDNYISSRNDGTSTKGFYIGSDGNLKYGTIGTSYTDAQARAAIRLTATGTSGAATYDSTTGTINVPNYSLNPWSGLANTASVFGTTATLSTQTGYSFSGTAPATWTLPSLSSNPNRWYFLKNRGTATVTVARAGSDNLYTTADVTSFTLEPGEWANVWGDALKWNVHKVTSGGGLDTTAANLKYVQNVFLRGDSLVKTKNNVESSITKVAKYSGTFSNGQVPAWNSTTSQFEPSTPGTSTDTILVSATQPTTTNFYFKPSDTTLNVKYGSVWFAFKQAGGGATTASSSGLELPALNWVSEHYGENGATNVISGAGALTTHSGGTPPVLTNSAIGSKKAWQIGASAGASNYFNFSYPLASTSYLMVATVVKQTTEISAGPIYYSHTGHFWQIKGTTQTVDNTTISGTPTIALNTPTVIVAWTDASGTHVRINGTTYNGATAAQIASGTITAAMGNYDANTGFLFQGYIGFMGIAAGTYSSTDAANVETALKNYYGL